MYVEITCLAKIIPLDLVTILKNSLFEQWHSRKINDLCEGTRDFDRHKPGSWANEGSLTDRSADLQGALRFCSGALRIAAAGYDPSRPADARACVRIALVGVIQLISELCPDEASVLVPLQELLYGLHDLDHGKVVPLLGPTKVSHSPGNALSDELFRAMAAAAMTCLVERTAMTREQAAKDVAGRLSRMGYNHPSGKKIKPAQIAWREKMMTELASENRAVA